MDWLFHNSETLRGHYRVVNWPSFNVVVFREWEGSREGESWGNASWSMDQSEHTKRLLEWSSPSHGYGLWCSPPPPKNYNHMIKGWLITDTISAIKVIKNWNILRLSKMTQTWTGKVAPLDLLDTGLSQNFNLKEWSRKCNKMKHYGSEVCPQYKRRDVVVPYFVVLIFISLMTNNESICSFKLIMFSNLTHI